MIRFVVNSIVVPTLFLLGAISAAAAECDFESPVGGCSASLKILSTSGSKPSFSAEILVSSSVKSCSKVEWFLDNTPQTTILKSQNSETESVFGTSAIKKQNISIEKCTAYAEKGAAGSAKAASRYGSCAGNAEAQALLDEYNAKASLSTSLPKIRAFLPKVKSMLAESKGYRSSDPEAYAKNKAVIDRDIYLLQEAVDWTTNAIRVLEGCAK